MLKKIILLIAASLTLNFSVKSANSELQNTEEIKKQLATTLAKHPEILEAIQIAQRIEKTQEVKPQDVAQLQKLYSKLEKSTDLSEEQRVQIKNLGERLQAFSAPACETMNLSEIPTEALVIGIPLAALDIAFTSIIAFIGIGFGSRSSGNLGEQLLFPTFILGGIGMMIYIITHNAKLLIQGKF